MNSIFDIINVPLGMLMKFLYGVFGNYAIAIFFFALVVKIVLLPLGIQQQNSQIKMAKIKPKEQAIRSKYAGRTDNATQQKMQNEVMDMYKVENYSPMGGCLPMLVQLPIIFALYNIVRNPLTYISGFSGELMSSIKEVVFNLKDIFSVEVASLANVTKFENIQQIDIIKVFSNPDWFSQIKSLVEGFPADFQHLDFSFLGQQLTRTPMEMGLSILLLIPVLNFAASFLQTRLSRKMNPAAAETANNKGMKIMEYTMPLMIVYMSYTWYSALGLYWIFQSILGIGQMFVLAKIKPIPKITEEEYELARQQYGTVKKKKKKKPVLETGEDGEIIEVEDIEITDDSDETESGDKYISKDIPKGINPNVKNNYQKTGKKYKIKKKK